MTTQSENCCRFGRCKLTHLKLEFVACKKTKEPFPPSAGIAKKVHLAALNDVGISFYPGIGTKDGVTGDHAWIAPAYTSTKHDIERIVSKVKESVILALG